MFFLCFLVLVKSYRKKKKNDKFKTGLTTSIIILLTKSSILGIGGVIYPSLRIVYTFLTVKHCIKPNVSPFVFARSWEKNVFQKEKLFKYYKSKTVLFEKTFSRIMRQKSNAKNLWEQMFLVKLHFYKITRHSITKVTNITPFLQNF